MEAQLQDTEVEVHAKVCEYGRGSVTPTSVKNKHFFPTKQINTLIRGPKGLALIGISEFCSSNIGLTVVEVLVFPRCEGFPQERTPTPILLRFLGVKHRRTEQVEEQWRDIWVRVRACVCVFRQACHKNKLEQERNV